MSLLSVHSDCQLAIVYAAHTYGGQDRCTLTSLLVLCKQFSQLIVENLSKIIVHYTVEMSYPTHLSYRFCGLYHREQDAQNNQPAIIYYNGTTVWYRFGKRHRDGDLPAIVRNNGTRIWYQHGKRHRDPTCDQPAYIWSNNKGMVWYKNGLIHRDPARDLPAIIWPDGSQSWYQDGKCHRAGEPAVIYANGEQAWWTDGVLVKHTDKVPVGVSDDD